MQNSMPSSNQRVNALKELHFRARARESLQTFTAYTTPRWEAGKIHRVISEQFDRVLNGEIDRLMLLCPPQHGKSTLASKRFPALVLGRQPTTDIISASATGSLAEEFGRDVRNCIDSAEYKHLFPKVTLAADSQARGRWMTQAGGGYYAVGVGGAVMGRGADLGLIDDPFATWADAQSETTRANVWEWYQGTFYNRVRPKAPIIVIQHRMHEADLVGRLLAQQAAGGDKWTVVELPALLDDPPWPERYNKAALERIKENTDPRKWSALYQQNPTPDEGTYFKRDWFKWYDPWEEIDGHRYISSDYAVTEDGGDWSEVATHAYAPTGDLYLAIQGWRGQTAPDKWIDETINQMKAHRPLCFFGESGVIRRATEPFLIRRMRERDAACRIEWITRNRDKTAMARPLQGLASMGRVHLPRNEYGQHLLHQFLGFPGAMTDDAVDMCGLMALAIEMAHPGVAKAAPVEKPKRDRWDQAFDQHDGVTTWRM